MGIKTAFVVSACALVLNTGAGAEPLRVIDGDGFYFTDGREIRLWGIDAPELGQTCERAGQAVQCGTMAKATLYAFLDAARDLSCQTVRRDRYSRHVSRWELNGADLSALMVRSGWALDWPRYSGGAYALDQDAAKEARRGLWGGSFVPPWEWRAER